MVSGEVGARSWYEDEQLELGRASELQLLEFGHDEVRGDGQVGFFPPMRENGSPAA